MKKPALTICLLVLTLTNLLSQSKSVSIRSGYLNTDDGKLFYEMAGEGNNIILIHDGMVHREIWNEQFLILARNYKVIRYDRKGYGKSSDPSAPYSDIEDLNQLFIQLQIDNAIIFGMSSGGRLAIDFTLKYPEKVNGLVLVGAVVSGLGFTNHMMTRGGNIKSFTGLSDPIKSIEYFVMDDPYEIYPKNIGAKEIVLDLMMKNIHQSAEIFSIPPERPAVNFLSEINVPALVLVGEYDIPDVQQQAGVIGFGIPNAKREIIPDSGHLIPIEQPAVFNAIVMKFLETIQFFNILSSLGVDAAIQFFNQMHERNAGYSPFNETEMNLLGYSYLQNGNLQNAIKLFKLNTIVFPKSWNVYDSLGEAYLKDGQVYIAIANYEKSIELNPDNGNARNVLKEITQKK
jgi:pimeloyl-ACP methyl ester carboxylesterase